MSVHEIAQQLDAAASRMLPDAELVEALSALAEAIVALHPIADTSSDDELRAALGALRNADAEIRRVWTACDQAVTLVEEYMTNNLGVPPGARPVASAPPPAEHAPSSTSEPAPEPPPTVQGVDGSEYPAAAGWCADMLPRRVRESEVGERTTGYANGDLSSRFVSGKDGTWTPFIEERCRAVGIPVRMAKFLSAHVELKVASMMIQRSQQHGEVVINHVPCGSQTSRSRAGCHQALETFLPEGHTLTVHGTTQQGEPYSHTYRGKA